MKSRKFRDRVDEELAARVAAAYELAVCLPKIEDIV